MCWALKKVPQRHCVDKDLAERLGELSGAIYLQALVLLGNELVTPSNCSDIFLGAVSCTFFLAPECVSCV